MTFENSLKKTFEEVGQRKLDGKSAKDYRFIWRSNSTISECSKSQQKKYAMHSKQTKIKSQKKSMFFQFRVAQPVAALQLGCEKMERE